MLRRAAASGSNLPSCGAVLLVVEIVLVTVEATIDVQTRTHRERQRTELLRTQLHLEVDHIASDQTEEELRDCKPHPVDALIQNRADDAERGMQQTGPYQRSDEARGENRLPGEHRQHGGVEQTD